MLHDKIPGYLPDWFRWTLVTIFLASIFFLFNAMVAKIKSRPNR